MFWPVEDLAAKDDTLDQHPVQGVTCLGRNFPPDQESHQNRNDDDGQCGRSAMEYVFVNASGPNRRPSCPFRGKKIGIKDRVMISRLMNNAGPTSTEASVIHLPAGGVVNLLTRMLMIPLLKPFVRISIICGGIHHRTDGNRYPSQRHDISVQSLKCMTIKAIHRPSGREIIATRAERTCHRNRHRRWPPR